MELATTMRRLVRVKNNTYGGESVVSWSLDWGGV